MASHDYAIPGCTCARLRKLSRRVTRVYDAHLAAAGLKTTQYSLLTNAAREPRTVTDLAAEMGMDRTTLTRNLRPLVANGWVRLSIGIDSRSRIVEVTPKGIGARKSAAAQWKKAQAELQATLGERNVTDLHSAVDAALAKLGGTGEE
jgi:DNA-binding MarR family transcriptional regulator